MTPYYQDGSVTIYHGDCRELVPLLGRFDLLLTDPPYGINAARHRNSQVNGWRDYGTAEESKWDASAPSIEEINACMDACERSVIWGGNYFSLPPRSGWFLWDKGQRDFSLADGELAWTSENKALRIFNYARSKAMQDGKEHPTQKPLELMRWCLSMFPDAQTVIDPFAGSGTTGRACKDLGRKCVMIEREERYCEIAARRMGQETLPFAQPEAVIQSPQQADLIPA